MSKLDKWKRIPHEYHFCQPLSDFWHTYRGLSILASTAQLVKKAAKQRMWNDGIIHYVNESAVMFEKPCHF